MPSGLRALPQRCQRRSAQCWRGAPKSACWHRRAAASKLRAVARDATWLWICAAYSASCMHLQQMRVWALDKTLCNCECRFASFSCLQCTCFEAAAFSFVNNSPTETTRCIHINVASTFRHSLLGPHHVAARHPCTPARHSPSPYRRNGLDRSRHATKVVCCRTQQHLEHRPHTAPLPWQPGARASAAVGNR